MESTDEGTTTPTLAKAPQMERERGEQVILEEFGSQEEFMNALEATIKEFDDGDIVEGVIVKVDADEVLLDIGYKSEGVIPSRELSIKHDINPHEVVAVGDVIEALVLQKEDKDGRLVLSKKRAQYERAWGKIEEIFNNDSTVAGTVIEVVKGGLILDIGLRGFLPASLVEMRRVRDLHPYVGRELECKVIELDKNRNNVVLSRRKFLEETQSEFRKEFLETLQKSEVRKGTVSSIVNFGAFVDLGGVDGLVHVSELSWKHIDHPGEVVEVGQEVEVEVLDVDLERERVSLSLKATQEDPWQQFARQHYVGEFIPGNVTKLVPFGAFVKVEDGIEGLIHISELAEAHVELPEQVVKVNDPITVKIIDIDDVRRRISLSLKQAVKAGYGEEPTITEEPAAALTAPDDDDDGSSSASAVGAALSAAFQQRDEQAAEQADETSEGSGMTVDEVVAEMRGDSRADQPEITEEPTGQLEVTEELTGQPEISGEPTDQPEVTEEPTDQLEVTEEPTGQPEISGEPTDQPEVTEEPTGQPEISGEPTDQPEVSEELAEPEEAATAEALTEEQPSDAAAPAQVDPAQPDVPDELPEVEAQAAEPEEPQPLTDGEAAAAEPELPAEPEPPAEAESSAEGEDGEAHATEDAVETEEARQG